MKKIIGILFLLSVWIGAASAQTATLTWTASASSTTANPGTVSVYRASGTCPASGIGTLKYTLLTATAPAAGPYQDTTITAGTWCYYITATISGGTSGPSNTVQNAIVTMPPTGLNVTVTVPSTSVSITTRPN